MQVVQLGGARMQVERDKNSQCGDHSLQVLHTQTCTLQVPH